MLTEVDVQATLRDKLGVDMEPYLILGACNPSLAHQALNADRRIGLLLPCNVVVRTEANQTVIEALDPQAMVAVAGEPRCSSPSLTRQRPGSERHRTLCESGLGCRPGRARRHRHAAGTKGPGGHDRRTCRWYPVGYLTEGNAADPQGAQTWTRYR